MGGRLLNPGESVRPGDILNPGGVHNRTIRAFVDTCDSANGTVKLDQYGFPAVGREASLPWLWATFRSKNETAWGRYIPFDGDVLKVSFDYDDTPHIVGYDVIAGDPTKSVGTGWAGLRKAQEEDQVPDFFTLNPGEFDFKSVGGAYIFGSDTGQLVLQGGGAEISIDKSSNEISADAKVHTENSGPSYIRFGEVRRPLPVVMTETPIGPWNPTLTAQEFEVSLQYSDGVLSHDVARFGIGNLATDLSVELANTGLPKMLAVELYDPTGTTQTFNFEADANGSVSMSAPTATELNVTYPIATININGAQIILSATEVRVGGVTSDEPMVLGNILVQAFLELAAGAIQSPVGPCFINPGWQVKYLASPLTSILSLRIMTER